MQALAVSLMCMLCRALCDLSCTVHAGQVLCTTATRRPVMQQAAQQAVHTKQFTPAEDMKVVLLSRAWVPAHGTDGACKSTGEQPQRTRCMPMQPSHAQYIRHLPMMQQTSSMMPKGCMCASEGDGACLPVLALSKMCHRLVPVPD